MHDSTGTFRCMVTVLLAVICSKDCVAELPGQGFDVPPNIILFMADDMGMGDTSAYQDFTGNSAEQQLATPSMERLARLGVRFTDAHTPSSRCTGTRYGLLTGRYPWRNRMKHWVLFGSQGDPMIEADRPTLATLLKTQGYSTGIVGKWHVGLRYRQSDGRPASAWADADLTQPLLDGPADHGFDFARFTSRSHGTSGPNAVEKNPTKKKNNGPGHVHGRTVMAASGNGKNLLASGPHAYILSKLGSRHSDSALEFLNGHVSRSASRLAPFFLYYPANSNHGPHTPDDFIGGVPVAGASLSKAGKPMTKRYDYVYENDVALGRLLDWLADTEDPRRPGHSLMENTLVIFTSDNGAEIKAKTATGPFRSNKGSVFEGGHRVPFLVSWPAGKVGDGNDATQGETNSTPINLTDMFATFAELSGASLPNLTEGHKGAEDSESVLAAFRGQQYIRSKPFVHNDHNEAKEDPAACAIRLDDPVIEEEKFSGQWKLFFNEDLIRYGVTKPTELYNLAQDQRERENLIDRPRLRPLVDHLAKLASLHRNSGGHRYAEIAAVSAQTIGPGDRWRSTDVGGLALDRKDGLTITLSASAKDSSARVIKTASGMAVSTGEPNLVDQGETLSIVFSQDVIVDFVALRAGQSGVCGGFYRVGNQAPLAIYCVDGDNDAKDQEGNLSDIGLVKAGEPLILNASPHFGVEAAGAWQLEKLQFRSIVH